MGARTQSEVANVEWSVASTGDALELFHPAVAEWFRHSFPEPTPPQAQGWPAIAQGRSTLILAPTGSGKTLTAFLWCINRLMFEAAPDRGRRCRVLYISPLKALAVDIERNLRAPLAGIANRADARGDVYQSPAIAVRTGDTPAIERARFQRDPSDILITTPESLYLLLTSNAREALRSVDTVIIDEIHALVPTKRGAHLALSLERLESIRGTGVSPLQRIGLSATQRPLDEVARFLGGARPDSSASSTVVLSRCRRHRHLSEEAPRPHHRGAGRRHGPHRTGRGDPERPRSAGTGALDHLVGDPPAAPRAHQGPSFDADLREQPSYRRAAGERDQRARRRDAGAVAPWLGRAGAANRSGRSAQSRAHPRPGRNLVARARHRYGRDRPGDPDRSAAVGRERHAADRQVGAHDRRGEPRHHRAEVPRRPGRVRRRDQSDARRACREHEISAQSVGRPRATDRRDGVGR